MSLRSIYQHFDDLESLFAEAGVRQVARIFAMVDRLPREGSLDERCAAFIGQRCRWNLDRYGWRRFWQRRYRRQHLGRWTDG